VNVVVVWGEIGMEIKEIFGFENFGNLRLENYKMNFV
jgi:hypothetical protein